MRLFDKLLYKCTIFDNKYAKHGTQRNLAKHQLLGLFAYDIRTDKDGALFAPAEFKGNRCKKNVERVHMLVFDIDEGAPYIPLYNKFAYDWITYTTFSHITDKPKWRLVIPLKRAIPGNEWRYAYKAMVDLWKKLYPDHPNALDASCKDQSRMYYLPSCHPSTEHNRRMDTSLSGKLYTLQYDYIIARETEEQREYRRILEAQQEMRQKNKRRQPLYIETKRELMIEYATNPNYRAHLAQRIGTIKGDRCEDWDCIVCGRNDATFFYINPSGGHRAYCAHMNTCGTQGELTSYSLFKLAEYYGI